MLTFIKRAVRRIIGPTRASSGLSYWEKRAKQLGVRAVVNIGHSDGEIAAVTAMQVAEIFPHLKAQLNGAKQQMILDYGCGPGRFTVKLAEAIHGQAIGVDPIKRLIDRAPASSRVRYALCKEGSIPLADDSVDVAWVCLVMGGILPASIPVTVAEICRVLKRGGLLFLIENTSEGKASSEHWVFRSIEEYRTMFPFAPLKHLHNYYDLGERMSVLAGRKN
jgi:SAM-dependent methyltransferase